MASDYADRMQDYAQRLMGYKTGEMVSLLVHIGDELGLYEAMEGKDSVDAESLATTGPEVPVVNDVQQTGFTGAAAYALSEDGVLAYVPGSDTTGAGNRILVRVDRAGLEEPIGLEPLVSLNPRLSPDGQRVALSVLRAGNWDIWIHDIARGTRTRLTS